MAPNKAPPEPPLTENPPESLPLPPLELSDGVYRKELSEDQLKGFYESSYTSQDEMMIYLANILGLRDHSYKVRNGIIIDYFSGFLLFAKEAGLSVQSTFHVYKLSHDILELINAGASFEEAERHCKKLLLKLTIHQQKMDIPPLSELDFHKIAPFFTTTVFQHFALLSFCFSHDHSYWFTSEQLWVETPLTAPLKESFTQPELDEIQAAKEAAENAEVVAQLLDYLMFWAIEEIVGAEEAALLNLDLLSPDEYVKQKPDTLEEAIERACRHKIEEATKMFHEDYEGRELKMLKKLVELEVKLGVAPPKAAAAAPPPPPLTESTPAPASSAPKKN